MAKKALTFDAAMERLEDVVARLESGDLELEQALALYEEGVALVRNCAKQLEEARQKVQQLQLSPTGEVSLVEFDADGGEA